MIGGLSGMQAVAQTSLERTSQSAVVQICTTDVGISGIPHRRAPPK